MVSTQSRIRDLKRPPGVYFDFDERPAPTMRRRSDVAGFVGAVYSINVDGGYRQQPPDDHKPKAYRCDSLQDFYALFGELPPDGYLGAAVRGFFANGGQTCYVAPIQIKEPEIGVKAADDLGLTVEKFSDDDGNGALDQLALIDAVSLLAAPDASLLRHGDGVEKVRGALIAQAERLRDRVALLDPPRDSDVRREVSIAKSESGLAALYWPWIKIANESASDIVEPAREVPPSGHIAGTIARRDLEQGVFAPPANMRIEGAVGVASELSPQERFDVNKEGINVICAMPGRGIRAMGARTWCISVEYKWLNVRRLVTHLCEWIEEDTQWIVFEPHSETLWRSTERLVRTILFDLWRRGGLVGETDDEAYFVRCDRTTNPDAEIEAGRVTCLISLSPPRPAERIEVRVGFAEGRVELLNDEPIHG
ncbi:phage tail sheath family protein [Rhizobium ruizarguesonis]|uniref:phage tail sheath family protein n=1 Tax=Rhizobium ruizarguesonis TaxID=2081791 RepID=UPI0016399EE8|nr:phage tail sheath subtilisin-like domain-containing protein [Rhizobium ruizarguesonis]MBC2802371.1 phage tail sheath family protein [Rhizobium ruizarguesonis]